MPRLQAHLLTADVLHHLLPQASKASYRRRVGTRRLLRASADRTVGSLLEDLGRHAILFHARCRGHLPAVSETIVHDHFEVFIGRQDRALGIGTAVGSESWFVYDFIKCRSERRPDRSTPAMRLGLTDTRWRWERVLSRRLFCERELMPDSTRSIYRKGWTRTLPALALKHAA